MSDAPNGTKRELRDYQIQAISRLRQSLAGGKRRPVLMAPTGAGKTVVAGEIIALAREKQKRVAFCVPALSLIDQTVERFWQHGVRDVGVIQADHVLTDWSKPVQICSIQTLERRGFPEADLVIVDECHRRSALVDRWIEHPRWQTVPFVGLSATPWAKGMGKTWDDLIVVATTAQLIERGYLSPFRVFAPSHPDLSGVKIIGGDYHEGQLSERMSKPQLVADVVETWIKLGEGRPTLVFAVDRAHAKHLQDCFEASGIPCGYQDAFTPRDERERLRKQFHDGRLKVVCSVGTLIVGVDWDVRCLIFARPTRSEMLFCQAIGRGLRTARAKENCLILDHSDNHLRLGFVTDIHHDTLDDGKPKGSQKRQAPLPKECSQCHFLKPPKTRKCPNCGFAAEAKTDVEEVDGELGELRPKGKKEAPAGYVRIGGAIISQRDFFGQLKRHARERGFKSGWAPNQFREMTGTWPNHYRDAMETPVSYEVASWIKSRMIRWAKRRRSDAAQSPDAA